MTLEGHSRVTTRGQCLLSDWPNAAGQATGGDGTGSRTPSGSRFHSGRAANLSGSANLSPSRVSVRQSATLTHRHFRSAIFIVWILEQNRNTAAAAICRGPERQVPGPPGKRLCLLSFGAPAHILAEIWIFIFTPRCVPKFKHRFGLLWHFAFSVKQAL